MTNQKIDLFQLFTLTFFLTITTFSITIQNIIKQSGSDTIISITIGTIISLGIFYLILLLRKNLSLKKLKNSLFTIIILSISYLYLLLKTTTFIKENFLINGNFYSIIILLFITNLITSKKSYKEISSLSLLLFFIYIPLFIINIIGSIKTLDINYLTPPFINNLTNILIGSLLFSIDITLPLLLLLFIPYQEINHKKRQNHYLMTAFLLGILSIIISYLILYFSSSITIIKSYNYPFMLVINSLKDTLTIGRFTYIISYYLLFPLLITLSLILTTIKHLIQNKYIPKSLNSSSESLKD